MGFLTNVYMLIDYGDFVDTSTTTTNNPYVQLLSTTDPAQAHADFVAVRLNGTDTTGSQKKPGSGSGSGSGNNDTSKAKTFFEKYKIPIIATAAAGVVLLLLGTAFAQFRARKPPYRPLFEPAPIGSMQMQTVSGYNPGMPPPGEYYNGQPQYADPWGQGR